MAYMRRINGILKEKTRRYDEGRATIRTHEIEALDHNGTCGLDCAMLSIRIGCNECMLFIFSHRKQILL